MATERIEVASSLYISAEFLQFMHLSLSIDLVEKLCGGIILEMLFRDSIEFRIELEAGLKTKHSH